MIKSFRDVKFGPKWNLLLGESWHDKHDFIFRMILEVDTDINLQRYVATTDFRSNLECIYRILKMSPDVLVLMDPGLGQHWLEVHKLMQALWNLNEAGCQVIISSNNPLVIDRLGFGSAQEVKQSFIIFDESLMLVRF
jgi:hypothetical protein